MKNLFGLTRIFANAGGMKACILNGIDKKIIKSHLTLSICRLYELSQHIIRTEHSPNKPFYIIIIK